MRYRRVAGSLGAWAVALAWMVAAAGPCPAAESQAQKPAPRVRIVAYINVSSGCQAATVKYLKAFAANHRDTVSLELIDFGSEEGAERWQADGHHCETIVINSATQFRVGNGDSAHVALFEMPEGVRWSFADMSAVLAQELRAPNSSALADAEVEKLARRVPVAWRATSWNGKVAGEVMVAAQTVFRFSRSFAGRAPAERARRAATTLKRLHAAGLRSDEIKTQKRKVAGVEVGAILARGREVAVVTSTEADIMRRPPLQVAQVWALNLRDALRLLGR